MPLEAPESFELDDPILSRQSRDEDEYNSDTSALEELDPLNASERPYTDDASRSLRHVFDPEKNRRPHTTPLAWLDSQRGKGRWQPWLIPSQFCCCLIFLFVATVVLLLVVGELWMYRVSASDSALLVDFVAEPWYTAPSGGTVERWRKSYEKAAKLVSQMSLVEKVNVTTGTGWSMDMCVGNTGTVDRLGFPSLCLQDGPLGLRFVDNASAFPAGVTVGATWNKELFYARGKAQGFEARLKGVNVLLGPSMGPLGRLPAGGRNWEGFGADPVLQGAAASGIIKGIQESGVIATAKHYVGNEQEHFRQSWEWDTPDAISSNVDDRTMHEIYAWPFAESIRAGVASVMCSYNQVNNSYACQNSKLLNGILKDELGFQGFVQSDWLAQRSGVASALAGLDMTMPGDGLRWQDGQSLWGGELTKAVLNSSVPMERLNDMALRVVAAWYQLGQDNVTRWPSVADGGGPNFSSWTNDEEGKLHHGSPNSKDTGVVNHFVPVRNITESGDHDALSRRIAGEGIVLVKNTDTILPLSRNGSRITAKAGGRVKIGVFGEDAYPSPRGNNACADRGCNEGTLAMGWGSGAVELPYLIAPSDALHANFDGQSVELTDWKTNEVRHVDNTASEQDLCLVFINSDAGEGYLSWSNIHGDRNDLYPQKGGDELVRQVVSSCGGDTIVVLHTVGPTILEKWVDLPGVKAVLIAHLPGEESGNALVDVLFGDVNPSGHLPYTIAMNEEDYGPDSHILRSPNGVVPQQDFKEALYMDYRYFDKHNITPRYEFGYGLSYTTFKLSSVFVQTHGSHKSEPAARPAGIESPRLDETVPDPSTALWPTDMKKNRLDKYIYPYISRTSDVKKGLYDYPKGYSTPHSPSQAGGAEGGNPDLYRTAVSVQATLTNLGRVPGSAVVQLYISFPENVVDSMGVAVDMPVRVLRNFTKIYVGTSNEQMRQPVRLELTRKDISYWDVTAQNWIVPDGQFGVALGFSSRDLEAKSSFAAKFNLGGIGDT